MSRQPLSDAFWGCSFCKGRGCLACQQESRRAYEKQFPNGPTPLVSIKYDDSNGMSALASILSAAGIRAARTEAKERVKTNLDSVAERLSTLGFGEANPQFIEALEAEEFVNVLTEQLEAIPSSAEEEQS